MPERIDKETIAALMDGKLSRRQRNSVLAHLAASEDDYEVFTETAAIVHEIEDEERAAAGFPGGATTRLGRLGQLLRRLGAAIRFRR